MKMTTELAVARVRKSEDNVKVSPLDLLKSCHC
jgi:hypothetical protein